MEKKNLFKTSEFWCFFIAIAEFILFLIWGLNMNGGDEMGYTLITVYAAVPLTALILTVTLTAKKSKGTIILIILMVLIEIFLPFFIFSTFEIALSLGLSLIPCAIGGTVGYLISRK